MKSDEYPDRERLGKAIIFQTDCQPYKGIEKKQLIVRKIHEEYIAWEKAGEIFRRILHRARLEEALRKAGYEIKSRRV